MGKHAREPRPRPEDDPFGVENGRHRLGACRRRRRHQGDGHHVAARGRDGHLPTNRADRQRISRIEPGNLGFDVERDDRHRQHPALRAQQPADQVEGRHRVAEQLVDRDDQQVSDGVPVELATALESVLYHLSPGAAPVIVTTQGRESLAQVARREPTELAAQAATRTAVVGHGHDRGQLIGHPAQGRQRRRQTVTTAERDDPRPSAQWRRGGHSRPRSRWVTRTSMLSPASSPVRAAPAGRNA